MLSNMDKPLQKTVYADDDREGVSLLVRLRLPWLIVGLIGALFASVIVSRYEEVLAQNVSIAFFLPAIIYLAGAVGMQTETIYIRNSSRGKVNFHTYLIKETLLGVVLGIILGAIMGVFAYVWLQDQAVAMIIGLATLANIAVAPLLALLLSSLLQHERTDPALGAGPFATVLQDILSIFIYFAIASVILFA